MTAIKSHIKTVKAWAVVDLQGNPQDFEFDKRLLFAYDDEKIVRCEVRYEVPVKAGKLK